MELCRTWWISGEKRFQNTKTSFKDRLFTRPMKAWGRESRRRLATYLDLAPLCDNQFLHPMFVLGHQPLTVCDRKVLDTIMKVLMIKVSLYCCENKINTITPQFYYEHFSPRHELLWPRPSLSVSWQLVRHQSWPPCCHQSIITLLLQTCDKTRGKLQARINILYWM